MKDLATPAALSHERESKKHAELAKHNHTKAEKHRTALEILASVASAKKTKMTNDRESRGGRAP